ncbi:fibronectin type III-like domain-contianing protein [Streptomyces sp. WAC04114]|uniref:fibronectin type III-like domain-contianing protein n=1 Tax=Streptomyces sp. WAC04114 TaxID=2867961 RepID=UPI0035ABE043
MGGAQGPAARGRRVHRPAAPSSRTAAVALWPAGSASVEAAPGESAEAVGLPRRAFEIWDEATGSWSYVKGSYEIQVGRSITDRRISATINV